MFDVGGAELLIIALVAVIVLGPERLPKAARFAGLWVRRARAQWYSVEAELERELAQEDIKRQFAEPLAQMRPAIETLRQELKQEFDGLDPGLPARVNLDAPAMPVAEPSPPHTESVPADAPASDATVADEPHTGDLFGGAPRP
jgi:sec-independent protein translocase protein TatB